MFWAGDGRVRSGVDLVVEKRVIVWFAEWALDDQVTDDGGRHDDGEDCWGEVRKKLHSSLSR